MVKNNKKPLFYGHKIMLLTALEFVLAFSDLGYFVPFCSETLLYIPVVAAAYFYGIRASALISIVFGVTGIWESLISNTWEYNQYAFPFFSIDIIGGLCVILIVRILFGFLIGVLFWIFKNIKIYAYLKVSLLSSVSVLIYNTLAFLSTMLFFPIEDINGGHTLSNMFSIHQMIQMILIVITMCMLLYVSKNKWLNNIEKILYESMQSYYTKKLKREGALFVIVLYLIFFILMLHLYDMTLKVINIDEIDLPLQVRVMFINLQIQFLAGVLAAAYIIGVFITSYRIYLVYHINNADKDLMTGLYSKSTAVDYGATVVNNKKDFSDTYFMILDIDDFKGINDTYGHLMGDKVIINIARFLEKHFGAYGLVSRFGGDEFAVFITRSLSENDIIRKIKDFQSDAASILLGGVIKVTCSIGICHIDNEKKFDAVYRKADEMLYQVKTSGRNGYKFYKKCRKLVKI